MRESLPRQVRTRQNLVEAWSTTHPAEDLYMQQLQHLRDAEQLS